MSAVVAAAVVGGLTAVGYVNAFTAVGLALTTTALGTVLPILREKGMLGGALARYFLASGAIGELFPILAIAIFLSVNSRFSALISLAAIALVAAGVGRLPTVRARRPVGAHRPTRGRTRPARPPCG